MRCKMSVLLQSAAVEQATCASLLVKEERAEEDSDPGGEQNTNLRPNAEGAAVATSSVAAKSSPGPGEFTEALRSRRCALEVSALETALKVEPEKIGSIGQLQNAASARSSYGSYSAVSHGCNRLRTSFAQGVGKREADDPSCSYVAEMESESSSFHSELLVAQEHEGSRAHLGSPEVKQEVLPAVDPMLDEAETEMRCVWNHSTVSSRAALAPRRRGRGDGRREREQQGGVFGIQTTKSETLTKIKPDPLDGTGYEPRETRAVPSNDTAAHSKAGRREKVFICTICGKAFNRPKKVEIHLRVHTGEKPFRCMLCGKWFAESGNLKKHQRVHTGEKPFSCTQCGRRFAWIRNLKTHQLRSHT